MLYLLQYLLAVLWYNYMWQQFNTLFFWLYITPHNCGFKITQNDNSNHLYNFLLGIGIVFNIALGGGKGGMSGQHTDVV